MTDQPRGSRLGRAYTAVAHLTLATLITFVLINLALYAFPSLRTGLAVDTPLATLGLDRLMPAYPGWTRDDVVQLHDESRVIFRYEPIVEFRIRPIAGKYVNATPIGFRRGARELPWPPRPDALNVFVFGGSTTFGWLLPDGETIPAELDTLASAHTCREPIAIYNFAQPAYISTQEALFFQTLVRAGTAPDVAVFVDGFNEFFFRGEMAYSQDLRALMDGTDIRVQLGLGADLPLVLLSRELKGWLSRRGGPGQIDHDAEAKRFGSIIDQWLGNKALITSLAQHRNIRTAFVWQPIPAYKYDLQHHFLIRQEPIEAGQPIPYANIGRAYQAADARRPELEAGGDFLWLADMQQDRAENLYVDRVHYNAVMTRAIAGRILEFLNAKNLLGCGG